MADRCTWHRRARISAILDLGAGERHRATADASRPPVLVWDNLAGHLSASIVAWLFAHGVMPLYTPLGGSRLYLVESVQRISSRRALSGQHLQTVTQLITWLEDTVAAHPTPFVWTG